MDEQQEIPVKSTYIVTQFINPSNFILYNPNLRTESYDLERKQLEKNLENEIRAQTLKFFKKGDVVAYFWEEGKRFIRCQVDDVIIFNSVTHYFLFSIDYGVSLYSTRKENIHAVSQIVRFGKTPIMNKVSLKVLPIVTHFDYIENKKKTFYSDKWSELALKIFQQVLNKAAVIKFEVSDALPGHRGFMFGDLIITTFYGMVISMCDALCEAKIAKYPATPLEFTKNFDKLMSRYIERWNDNNKTGGILKNPEGKLALYYDDEILMKQYIANCETVQNRVLSVQKVMEWQQKIEGFEHIIPESNASCAENSDFFDTDAGCSQKQDEGDEGFDERIVKKKPIFSTRFGVMKNSKQDNRDKMSMVSGVSKSVSQIFPRSTARWTSKTDITANAQN